MASEQVTDRELILSLPPVSPPLPKYAHTCASHPLVHATHTQITYMYCYMYCSFLASFVCPSAPYPPNTHMHSPHPPIHTHTHTPHTHSHTHTHTHTHTDMTLQQTYPQTLIRSRTEWSSSNPLHSSWSAEHLKISYFPKGRLDARLGYFVMLETITVE